MAGYFNTSGIVGAVLMDLSKAFDCLPHDLLIAKLNAYGLGKNSLDLFHSYLTKRRHYTHVGSTLSDILEIFLGVPHLLSMYKEDICNFADDNTMSICGEHLPNVLQRIHNEMNVVLNWFTGNGMVANPDKFQTIFLGIETSIDIKIGSFTVTSSKEVKLLGVTLDDKLSFYPHTLKLCGKVFSKIKALKDLLFHCHIMSPFNYCPLVWMYCSKQAHSLLANIHKKALRARFNDFTLAYDEFLQKSELVSIHVRNLQL